VKREENANLLEKYTQAKQLEIANILKSKKKGLSRKHCCIVTKECVGDKCVEKRSKCKFTGSIARDGCLYRKKRVCKRAHHGASFKCNMAIEPSFKSFNGKSFNNLTSGKLLIVKKGTFSVKAERSKWDRSVVTTRLFVAKGKKQSRTRVSTISAGRFVVDGKHVSLKVKRSITTSNLLIKRESKNTVVIQTKKGNFIKITFNTRKNIKGKRRWYQSQFLTATIGVKSLGKSKGLCVDGQNGALKLKVVAPFKSSACQISFAHRVCKERKVPQGKKFNLCTKRFLATNPPCKEKKKVHGKRHKKCKGGKCRRHLKQRCSGKFCTKCKGPGCIHKTPKCKGKKCPKRKCPKTHRFHHGKCLKRHTKKEEIKKEEHK